MGFFLPPYKFLLDHRDFIYILDTPKYVVISILFLFIYFYLFIFYFFLISEGRILNKMLQSVNVLMCYLR
jgi:hypothetical protein